MKTRKKKTAKRRETPATRRLKKQNAALRAELELTALSLKKERTKNDCYHDPEHRYSLNRPARGKVLVKVTICGYCGRELSAEHLDQVAQARLSIEAVAARSDKPGDGGLGSFLMMEMTERIDRPIDEQWDGGSPRRQRSWRDL
jgi:hypothetical protein